MKPYSLNRLTLALLIAMTTTPLFAQKVQMKASPTGRNELRVQVGNRTQTLGYTDAPVTAGAEMPENMKQWLETAEEAARWAENDPTLQLGTAHRSDVVVQPLLGNNNWGQDGPFALYTPNRYPAGCVAISMAQVMHYYQYPQQGIGERTWIWNGKEQKANFGETTYKWDQMPDVIDDNITEEQKDALATLAYHCGIAVDMSWGANSSGANSCLVSPALKEYFGYNSLTSMVVREHYTFEQWQEILLNELKAGRPIIYSGRRTDSGHAFVVDGVNEEGLYHVNWGWDGEYNGYFDICLCSPYEAHEGYYINQGAIVQITPEEGVGDFYCPMCADVFLFYEYQGDCNGEFYCDADNISGRKMTASLGYELVEVATQRRDTVFIINKVTTDALEWPRYQSHIYASTLNPGDYLIRPIVRLHNYQDQVFPLLFKPVREYRSFTVRNDTIVNAQDYSTQSPSLTITNFSHEGQTLEVGVPTDIYIDVKNKGNTSFFGPIYFLRQGETMFVPDYSVTCPEMVHIAVGETERVHLIANFEEAFSSEIMFAAFDRPINYWYYPDDYVGHLTATVGANSPYDIALVSSPQLDNARCEVGSEISFSLEVENKGWNFDSQLAMQLYKSKKDPEANKLEPVQIITQEVEIESGATETVHVKGVLDVPAKVKYYARPYYKMRDGSFAPLLKQGLLTSPIEVAAYPAAIEQIENDETPQRAYDLLGRPVSAGYKGLLIKK